MIGPVSIVIDVLAVSGLDPSQARTFGDALRNELTRLVVSGGLPSRPTTPGLSTSMTLKGVSVAGNQSEQAGNAAARAIYRELAR